MTGACCRVYEASNGNLYSGPIVDGKQNGHGRLFDAKKDEVYDGLFESNKRNGEGIVYRRDGTVMNAIFKNNDVEGRCVYLQPIGPKEIEKIFNNAIKQGKLYISVKPDVSSKTALKEDSTFLY